MGAEAARKVERESHDGIFRRSVDIELRAINEEERSVEVVASSDALDSHGDIVEQTFDLKRYRKNPVVLWMHNSFGFLDGSRAEDFLPIGRAENVKVADGTLEAKLVFFKDPDPKGLSNQIFERFKQKVLRAVSIGFRPGKVVTEEIEGKERFRLSNNELFEISVVPMGSNPDAVAKAHALDQKILRRMADSAVEDGSPKDNTMDPKELQAKLDKALVDLGVAQKSLEDANAKVTKLEADLIAEKANSKKLGEDLKVASDRATKAEADIIDKTIDAFVGKKITAAERDEEIALAKEIGLDRVVKRLEKRADLPLLKDITGGDPKTKNTAADGGTGGATLADELEKDVAGAA